MPFILSREGFFSTELSPLWKFPEDRLVTKKASVKTEVILIFSLYFGHIHHKHASTSVTCHNMSKLVMCEHGSWFPMIWQSHGSIICEWCATDSLGVEKSSQVISVLLRTYYSIVRYSFLIHWRGLHFSLNVGNTNTMILEV